LNEKINMKDQSTNLNSSLRFAFKFSDANSIISLKPEIRYTDEKKKPGFSADGTTREIPEDYE
jgi:hypothetical protein